MTAALLPSRRQRSRPGPDDWLSTPEERVHGRVVALIPAHNEQDGIADTVRSLLTQTCPPHRVVVMADNCTDETVVRARAAGAEVRETVGNTAKKAGALNQGLANALPDLLDDDFVLTMDADSQLKPDFVENARLLFASAPEVGGLSGQIVARRHTNLLELSQAVEFARGVRQVGRRGGRVHVLSGAATVMRVGVLREVASHRGTTLPGSPGSVYLEDSLTEDYELTLAIRVLGHRCVATKHCQVITDVMPTIGELREQRVRWYRGSIESLDLYGWRRGLTGKTWMGVGVNYGASLLFPLVILLITVSIAFYEVWFDPRWLLLFVVMAAEQYTMARRVGVRLWRIPGLFFIFWAYDILLFRFCWIALLRIARGADRGWAATVPIGERR